MHIQPRSRPITVQVNITDNRYFGRLAAIGANFSFLDDTSDSTIDFGSNVTSIQ